jgi:putative proteasome-type protease
MTYCVGILVDAGMVMVADTRTNAGIDNIATFRKLHRFVKPGEKAFVLASSGNLAFTQAVVATCREGLEINNGLQRLIDQPSMFSAAQFVGRVIRHVYDVDGKALEQNGASLDVSFLLGGQVKGRSLRLYMLYKAGNFIEATTDTPYLQIGEHKYGKPILDRAVSHTTDIDDALKLALISMDSTMRSNLGVGLPIDVVTIRRDRIDLDLDLRIDASDAYFRDLRERWSAALRKAHIDIPRPPYSRK